MTANMVAPIELIQKVLDDPKIPIEMKAEDVIAAVDEAIALKARQLQMAGATVARGTLGYGRSTRLHTTEVVFSEDLPIIVEIVDSEERIAKFVPLLTGFEEIGLVTCDEVRVLLYPPIPCEK